MTAAELIAMVERATRAPLGMGTLGGDVMGEVKAQQELLRLSPALARLCAEQHKALAKVRAGFDAFYDGDSHPLLNSEAAVRPVIERFAALGEPASGEEGVA